MPLIDFAGWLVLYIAMGTGCWSEANVKDIRALEGEWNWVAIESNGIVSSPAEIKGQKWLIKGNVISGFVPGLPVHKMAFKLDASKAPKEMDVWPLYDPCKGKVDPMIYELEAGKLRVCVPSGFSPKDRPTDFTAEAMIFEKATR